MVEKKRNNLHKLGKEQKSQNVPWRQKSDLSFLKLIPAVYDSGITSGTVSDLSNSLFLIYFEYS